MTINFDTRDASTIAAGSVMDQLAERVAGLAESALTKTRVEDLTEAETMALAITAGCAFDVVMKKHHRYELRLKRRVAVSLIDGKFTVAEEPDAET